MTSDIRGRNVVASRGQISPLQLIGGDGVEVDFQFLFGYGVRVVIAARGGAARVGRRFSLGLRLGVRCPTTTALRAKTAPRELLITFLRIGPFNSSDDLDARTATINRYKCY
jgi:hypothetical protein